MEHESEFTAMQFTNSTASHRRPAMNTKYSFPLVAVTLLSALIADAIIPGLGDGCTMRRSMPLLKTIVPMYRERIAANPSEYTLYCERAKMYKEMRRGDLAMSDATKAIELSRGKSLYAYLTRAEIWEGYLLYITNAIEDLTSAMALSPFERQETIFGEPPAFNESLFPGWRGVWMPCRLLKQRARLWTQLGQVSNAFRDYSNLIDLLPSSDVFQNKGNTTMLFPFSYSDATGAMLSLGAYDECIAFASKGLSFANTAIGKQYLTLTEACAIYLHRAIAMGMKGQYTAMENELNKRNVSGVAGRLLWRLVADPSLHNPRVAQVAATIQCKRYPNDPAALAVLACVYAENGNFTKAVETAEKAASLEGGRYFASDCLLAFREKKTLFEWKKANKPAILCTPLSPDAEMAGLRSGMARKSQTSLHKSSPGLYLVIDLSKGPGTKAGYAISFLDHQPELTDDYKTSKILMRRVSAGNFMMGSPASEVGRTPVITGGIVMGSNLVDRSEVQHRVALTHDFYIGVYEITKTQYTNVMGRLERGMFDLSITSTQFVLRGSTRPVTLVKWNEMRGGAWPGNPPGSGLPASDSFIGKLRARTMRPFDLPTEAQWEYACRAGTTSAFNNGTGLDSVDSWYYEANGSPMDSIGLHSHNGGYWYLVANAGAIPDIDGEQAGSGLHDEVGNYLPNDWGLYDMHGNAVECCLDLYDEYRGDAIDPVGGISDYSPARPQRIARGGSSYRPPHNCRAASRAIECFLAERDVGFRICLTVDRPSGSSTGTNSVRRAGRVEKAATAKE